MGVLTGWAVLCLHTWKSSVLSKVGKCLMSSLGDPTEISISGSPGLTSSLPKSYVIFNAHGGEQTGIPSQRLVCHLQPGRSGEIYLVFFQVACRATFVLLKNRFMPILVLKSPVLV